MLDVPCWMFLAGRSLLDVPCWTFLAGRSLLDVRFKTNQLCAHGRGGWDADVALLKREYDIPDFLPARDIGICCANIFQRVMTIN
jgi:hypothetical protein